MATHDGEKHSEPRSLKDTPEFRELAELMKAMPAERRAEAFAAADSPPELKLFIENDTEATTDDRRSPPPGN